MSVKGLFFILNLLVGGFEAKVDNHITSYYSVTW